MTIIGESRGSDSPFVETIMHGHTISDGSSIRPGEINWHMVFVKHSRYTQLLLVGPLTMSGVASWKAGAEIVWIKFKLGTFMPRLPVRSYLDSETPLPGASTTSCWLDTSVWQFPDYENADTFVERLIRRDVLAHDPLVPAVLEGQTHDMPARTLRHRFLRATGLTQGHIRQYERAQQATALLRQGASIADTMFEAGYFDQPHLTRSLKHWVGYTPAQIIRMSRTEACRSVQDKQLTPAYDYER